MKKITSTKNQLVKDIKKLHKPKNRTVMQQFLVEGYHLVEEAIKAEAEIQKIFLLEEDFVKKNLKFSLKDFDEFYIVSEEVLKQISTTNTPQGILAVVKINEQTEYDFTKPFLVLDNVQDPGNVGTMIRTADAAGFGAVFLGEGCADIYSSKVQRSMQGSNYHLNIYRKDIFNLISELENTEIPIYGTALNADTTDYHAVNKTEVFGIIMGNEGQGVNSEILALTNQNLHIPILGKAESLNVAVAAGILMFELINNND